ncbi:MAG: DUF2683 family protein [Candidatus Micrarchaeota archaeon]
MPSKKDNRQKKSSEPELRPEYIAKIEKIKKEGKFIRVKDVKKYFMDMLK